MSYTNEDLVGRHVNFEDFQAGVRQNYPLFFETNDWISLPGNNITEASVVVKALIDIKPECESVVLSASPINLINKNLVPTSLTVASDSSVGQIYRETIDYSINYDNGILVRIDGGDITPGQTVILYYFKYKVYQEDSDYDVDYSDGKIRRLSGSTIIIGQAISVDYTVSSFARTEEIIGEAVAEANSIIEQTIDSGNNFGADLTLQTAATYLAVSLACRMAASSGLKDSNAGRQAVLSWVTLAEDYRRDYEQLIKKFRPDRSRLNYPTHS